MKKNLISVAVAASVLGGAAVHAAQHVSPDGTGQVLLFPFYNADNGNATNMHVVNTTDDVKAIKIRFVEHKNSDEVLDFNVYLSGKDHFAFGVIKNPNGTGGAVITADNSCTVPALGSANGSYSGSVATNAAGSTTRIQPFVNYQYGVGPAADFDSSIERTLTGHVEVIEMGVVGNTTVTNPGAPTPGELSQQYATMATHDATGVPASCAGLVAAWSADSGWGGNPSLNMTAPTGGLYGLAYHINVGAAAAFGFEPTAIAGWQSGDDADEQHTNPGTNTPSVVDGVKEAVVYGGPGTGYLAVAIDTGDAEADSAQAIGATLMTESLSNDVMVNAAIGGMTDWVVTFPTKNFHVDTGTAVIAPFTKQWTGIAEGATAGTYKEVPACEAVSIKQYDREEQTTVTGLVFSPKPPGTVASICNEVAVIAMGPTGTASALSVTTGLSTLGSAYAEGWQKIGFDDQTMTVGGVKMDGLPAIGFGAYKVNNGAMSYGNASEHKTAATNSAVGG